MTQTTQAVLRALLDRRSEDVYGLEICGATGLPSGTVHPILARFEALGWLESSWEEVDPREQGRPRRRYYRLNADGAALARERWPGLIRPEPGSSPGFVPPASCRSDVPAVGRW